MWTRFPAVLGTALIIAVAVTPRTVDAQMCMRCGIPETGFCASGVGPRHQDWEGSNPDWYDPEEAWHWECVAGANQECEDYHSNECMFDLSMSVTAAIRSDDPRRILALLGTTDRYYINWERSAVQGKACKGDAVVRHIPVSGQLLSKLRARVAADLLEAPWQTLMGSQLFTRDRD